MLSYQLLYCVMIVLVGFFGFVFAAWGTNGKSRLFGMIYLFFAVLALFPLRNVLENFTFFN